MTWTKYLDFKIIYSSSGLIACFKEVFQLNHIELFLQK